MAAAHAGATAAEASKPHRPILQLRPEHRDRIAAELWLFGPANWHMREKANG